MWNEILINIKYGATFKTLHIFDTESLIMPTYGIENEYYTQKIVSEIYNL